MASKQQELQQQDYKDDEQLDIDSFSQQTELNQKYTNLQNLIELKTIPLQQMLLLNSENSTKFPALLQINTKSIIDDNQIIEEGQEFKKLNANRMGLDLIVVLDQSGSMYGKKIELLKQALLSMLQFLTPNDRISLIAFNSQAKRLCNLQRVTEQNLSTLKKIIQQDIQAGGETSIKEGLQMAINVLQNRKQVNSLTSIFVLSDGLDYTMYSQMSQLTTQITQSNINFSIYTFGFGNDHDPILMKNIAQLGDGTFHYIENLELIDICFADSLGNLFSTIAQNVVIRVQVSKQNAQQNKIFSDIRVSKTFGKWIYNEQAQAYETTIKQLTGGKSRDFVFEINMPPLKTHIEDQLQEYQVQVLDCEMALNKLYQNQNDAFNAQVYAFKTNLNIIGVHEQQLNLIENKNFFLPNKYVLKNYLRVQAAETLQNANSMAEKGNMQQAQIQLEDQIQLIKKSEVGEEEELKLLVLDLEKAFMGCQNKYEYLQYGQKQMSSKCYSHMNQQSTPSDQYQNLYQTIIQRSMTTTISNQQNQKKSENFTN